MRILHVVTGLATGGAEIQLMDVLEHSRHEADVVGLYDFGYTGRTLRSRGVATYSLDLPRNYDPRAVPRLVRLMRRGRYDIVHTHLYRASVHGRVAAKLAKVPVVVTSEPSLGEREIEGRAITSPVKALYLATERLATMTIAISPWVRDLLIDWGVSPSKITVIPYGLDLAAFRFVPDEREAARAAFGIPEDATVIGTVGRLVPRKQQAVVIQAAANLVRDGAWLLLVGSGPERPRLERLAGDAGLSTRTIFAGERHDIRAMLSCMDVFVSPSFEEMFGLAPVEALASGLPVLVTHCPGLDGIGPPHVWWVPDRSDEIRDVLPEALASAPDREALPQEFRDGLDIRAAAHRIDDLYDDLTASGNGSRSHRAAR